MNGGAFICEYIARNHQLYDLNLNSAKWNEIYDFLDTEECHHVRMSFNSATIVIDLNK